MALIDHRQFWSNAAFLIGAVARAGVKGWMIEPMAELQVFHSPSDNSTVMAIR